MDIQEIEVLIDKNGKINLMVHGVKGTACLDLTEDLEQMLGSLISRQMTSEAQEEPDTTIDQSSTLKNSAS